jgi:hypothetical protein
MRLPSADIEPAIRRLGRGVRCTLALGGFARLVAGDTGAIWGSHNVHAAAEFDALFQLLALHPDREMEFLCVVEDLVPNAG